VVLDFQYDDGGIGRGGIATLSADGRPIAQGRVDRTVPVRFSLDETFDVGRRHCTPVSEDYDVPTGSPEKWKRSSSSSGTPG